MPVPVATAIWWLLPMRIVLTRPHRTDTAEYHAAKHAPLMAAQHTLLIGTTLGARHVPFQLSHAGWTELGTTLVLCAYLVLLRAFNASRARAIQEEQVRRTACPPHDRRCRCRRHRRHFCLHSAVDDAGDSPGFRRCGPVSGDGCFARSTPLRPPGDRRRLHCSSRGP